MATTRSRTIGGSMNGTRPNSSPSGMSTVTSAAVLPFAAKALPESLGRSNGGAAIATGSFATMPASMSSVDGFVREMVPVIPETSARIAPGAVAEFRDRRRRRRVRVPEAYSLAMVRVLGDQTEPIEGFVVNLSETGVMVEIDHLVPAGSAVTVEFCVTGLGRLRNETWPTFAAAAEVVRHENVEDFPGGPYRTALRFVRMSTMVQAQLARYVVAHQ